VVWLIVAVVGLAVLALLHIWLTRRWLMRARTTVNEAWSGITVQLRRRADLVPTLIGAVVGHAPNGEKSFDNVVNARDDMLTAVEGGPAAAAAAEIGFQHELKSLFAVAATHPDLETSQTFRQLRVELTDTEDKIAAARRFYNSNVNGYNTKLQSFPANMFGRVMGFSSREFYDVPDATTIPAFFT
jgi:LemA protein